MSHSIIFFGSPTFSAQILESLLNSGISITGVVTNPDKPIGRQKILTPSPVAQVAAKYHLPTFKPETLDPNASAKGRSVSGGNLAHLKLLQPDLFLIIAYGKIIPQAWLDLPRKSALNIHFSLLPRYRGALCIQEAIKNQDSKTGVTFMEIDAEMDHGPIIAQLEQAITIDDNLATLTEKLTQKAITLLNQKLPLYLNNKLKPQPQNHSQATYTPSYRNLNRNSAYLPWTDLKAAQQGINAAKIHALIRSLNPEPGAWTHLPAGMTKVNQQELKILSTNLDSKLETLVIQKVQLPGKNPISFKQLLSNQKI